MWTHAVKSLKSFAESNLKVDSTSMSVPVRTLPSARRWPLSPASQNRSRAPMISEVGEGGASTGGVV